MNDEIDEERKKERKKELLSCSVKKKLIDWREEKKNYSMEKKTLKVKKWNFNEYIRGRERKNKWT